MAGTCENHDKMVKDVKEMLKDQHKEIKGQLKDGLERQDKRIEKIEDKISDHDKNYERLSTVVEKFDKTLDKFSEKFDSWVEKVSNIDYETRRNTETTNEVRAGKNTIVKWVVGGSLTGLMILYSMAEKIAEILK